MNSLYTNSDKRKDFLKWSLEALSKNRDVYIAVAFFTDHDFIKRIIEQGCNVFLIVRLGFPTSPESLYRIIDNKNLSIRFFTDSSYHPKIYILGNEAAFVGSSNLTRHGILRNQEANIRIDNDNPVFKDIKEVFMEYWKAAQPLEIRHIDSYKQIVKDLFSSANIANKKIKEKIGNYTFGNIQRTGISQRSRKLTHSEEFIKQYKSVLSKFESLKDIYKSVGRRKELHSPIPLSIEIDQFLNWIKQKKARGNSYLEAPLRRDQELIQFITNNINEFIDAEFPDIHEVAEKSYPLFRDNLLSEKNFNALSEDQLINILSSLNAFSSRARFFVNIDKLKNKFLNDNGFDKIKTTINFLLFGNGDFKDRISKCIFEEDYKLRHFGVSCIEELFGWANQLEIPICNKRTNQSLQWLGFGIM